MNFTKRRILQRGEFYKEENSTKKKFLDYVLLFQACSIPFTYNVGGCNNKNATKKSRDIERIFQDSNVKENSGNRFDQGKNTSCLSPDS